MRAARELLERRDPARLIPGDPLVPRLPADPVPRTQRRHVIVGAARFPHKLLLLIHRTRLSPRHRTPRRGLDAVRVLPMSLDCSVTHQSRPYRALPNGELYLRRIHGSGWLATLACRIVMVRRR